MKRLEVEVSKETQEFLAEEAKRLNTTIKSFGGRILSSKVNSFAKAADSDAKIQALMSAIVGQLAELDRSVTLLQEMIEKRSS